MASFSDSDHLSSEEEDREETEFYAEDTFDTEAHEPLEVEVIDVFELNENSFEELKLAPEVISETQEVWFAFINLAASRDAAGEAIYSAIFEAAPSLQNLFKTPRAVMAMRFMNGLNTIITSMDNPSSLKITTETLGFQHLDLEVTAPRVMMFRDAITELFETELQGRFTSRARSGMMSVLNYVGGAYIFIRREYASRIKIIQKSWRAANKTQEEEDDQDSTAEPGGTSGSDRTMERLGSRQMTKSSTWSKEDSKELLDREAREAKKTMETMKVPTTFNEMFLFNAAVMGFSSSVWMQLVLEQFSAIVNNAANSYRLQEECDIMALRLAKYRGSIQLNEFKAVMLAALRSLVDSIKRYGGSTAPTMPWPEEQEYDEDCRLERLEKIMSRAVKKMGKGQNESRLGTSSKGSSASSGMSSQSSNDGEAEVL